MPEQSSTRLEQALIQWLNALRHINDDDEDGDLDRGAGPDDDDDDAGDDYLDVPGRRRRGGAGNAGGDGSGSGLGMSRDIRDITDLCDGVGFGEVLHKLNPTFFPLRNFLSSSQSHPPSSSSSDNNANGGGNNNASSTTWVLRFNNLKRLFKFLQRYYEEILNLPPVDSPSAPDPDLQKIARDLDRKATCDLAERILVACCVQKEGDERGNEPYVLAITKLEPWAQGEMKQCIERVMNSRGVQGPGSGSGQDGLIEDIEGSSDRHQSIINEYEERLASVYREKQTIEGVYQELISRYNVLNETNEENMRQIKSLEDDLTTASRRNEGSSIIDDKLDAIMRRELEGVKDQLQKTEGQLDEAEALVSKQEEQINDLTRKAEELTGRAEQADRLKDQMDEYRHAADKLKKTENVIEKYKKKLEESADLRRQMKTLEDQNADLVDRHAALEEEHRKVSAFKPLMESYKTQIANLESKTSTMTKESDALRFELRRTREQLRQAKEDKEREVESAGLYEERIKELEAELGGSKKRRGTVTAGPNGAVEDSVADGGFDISVGTDEGLDGVGGELDDAIAGTTMTDLKLQIRKLKKDLEEARANKADVSRIVVLENLLEDSNRMKVRYESDYLREHREKLVLQSQLEEIRSGKTGDGGEAAIALRQRLNETVEELESVKRQLTEITVRHEMSSKELTIAKADLNLVNKDQLDILNSLRASVSVEKDALEVEMKRMKEDGVVKDDKLKMQMSQINNLLLEKVNLQSEGIGQREKMLERERDYGKLRATLAGKGLTEEDQARFTALQQERDSLQDKVKDQSEQLQKAKRFIKQQDKLFKEAHATASQGNFEQAEESYQSEINRLKEDLDRQQRMNREVEQRYQREQALMLSAWHELNMRSLLDSVASNNGARRSTGPSAWLGQQRQRTVGKSLR